MHRQRGREIHVRTSVATGESRNKDTLLCTWGGNPAHTGRYHNLCKVFKPMDPKLKQGSHLIDIYVPYFASRSKSSRRKNQSL